MKAADKEWKSVNKRIYDCLQKAAAELLKQGDILESEYDDFFISGKDSFLFMWETLPRIFLGNQ